MESIIKRFRFAAESINNYVHIFWQIHWILQTTLVTVSFENKIPPEHLKYAPHLTVCTSLDQMVLDILFRVCSSVCLFFCMSVCLPFCTSVRKHLLYLNVWSVGPILSEDHMMTLTPPPQTLSVSQAHPSSSFLEKKRPCQTIVLTYNINEISLQLCELLQFGFVWFAFWFCFVTVKSWNNLYF